MKSPEILFVGDFEAELFRTALGWLADCGTLQCVAQISAAQAVCRDHSPRLIVFGQLRPGQFNASEIERVHRLVPLARVVALLGTWCEGETRTGSPWPGVMRIYWHQFSQQVAGELVADGGTKWALPRTSTDVERMLTPSRAWRSAQGLIVVRTCDQLSFEVITDLLVEVGYATARVSGDEPFAVSGAVGGIWGCELSVAADRPALQRFVEQLEPAPVVALVSFLRAVDRQLALECGVKAALSKPLLISDLLNALAAAQPDAQGPRLRVRESA